MGKKGLSLEEKRNKMVEIFHDSNDFYTLKELEKMGPKLKGIVSQSVKEVLDGLVSDHLVCTEKIGTSNYFWSYPNTVLVAQKRKASSLEDAIASQSAKRMTLESDIQEAKLSRASENRLELLEQWKELKAQNSQLKKDLMVYRDSDPEMIEKKRGAVQTAKNAANRWADNIYALSSYLVKTFAMDSSLVRSMFSVPDEFDVLE